MKLCDGVYSYVWKGVFVNNCNTFFFGDPLNMIIDPGLTNYLDTKFVDMKHDGIDPEKIKRTLLTHCHPDHFESAGFFLKKNIPLAMHEEEISFFNSKGPAFFQMFGMPFPEMKFDTILKEGTWNVDGVELEVIHTPGHSPGSVCIYWKDKKVLACGDLVFQQSVGRVDFPGGDGTELIRSIRKIRDLDVEYLLPGHMDIIQGADNIKRNFDFIDKYYSNMM